MCEVSTIVFGNSTCNSEDIAERDILTYILTYGLP